MAHRYRRTDRHANADNSGFLFKLVKTNKKNYLIKNVTHNITIHFSDEYIPIVDPRKKYTNVKCGKIRREYDLYK